MSGTAEIVRALGALCEPPAHHSPVLADALGLERAPGPDEFVESFVLQLYPYSSVYLGAEGMLGGEARDRVAGFWRALGLTPPPEPDHLAALLGLYASLIEAIDDEPDGARAALLQRARAAMLWEHLSSWLAPYLHKIDGAPDPCAGWAKLLRAVLAVEEARTPPPPQLPLALREAPGLPDDDSALREWTQALLAPVRSGMILTRADLARGARQIGVGVRLGERAFILRSMLEQNAYAVMVWLVSEATVWIDVHETAPTGRGEVARWWAERARHTATVLRNLTRGPAPTDVASG
jgi:Nitrate reductase delta subunit